MKNTDFVSKHNRKAQEWTEANPPVEGGYELPRYVAERLMVYMAPPNSILSPGHSPDCWQSDRAGDIQAYCRTIPHD